MSAVTVSFFVQSEQWAGVVSYALIARSKSCSGVCNFWLQLYCIYFVKNKIASTCVFVYCQCGLARVISRTSLFSIFYLINGLENAK